MSLVFSLANAKSTDYRRKSKLNVNYVNLTFCVSCFRVIRMENKVFMKDIFSVTLNKQAEISRYKYQEIYEIASRRFDLCCIHTQTCLIKLTFSSC